MKTIEALSPGLYEMKIDEQIGEGLDAHFLVSFEERTMSDVLAFDDDDRSDEIGFAAVARLSELSVELYDLVLRPFVQTMVTPLTAKTLKSTHPARAQRLIFADQNPFMRPVSEIAARVSKDHEPLDPFHPFLALEKWWAAGVLQTIDFMRDLRDVGYETIFLSIYGSPLMTLIGASHAFERTRKDPKDLRWLPEVQAILVGIDRGGFEEAVIRMLILLAEARGAVRRDRLQRSAHVLTNDEPFASLGTERRAALIREQSIIAQFEPDRAVETLPNLLPESRRRDAIDVVEYIAGSVDDMEPYTVRMLQRFRAALGLPRIALSVATRDPLANSSAAPAS